MKNQDGHLRDAGRLVYTQLAVCMPVTDRGVAGETRDLCWMRMAAILGARGQDGGLFILTRVDAGITR